jgi:uncharacterized protein (TIGR02391 family)
MNLEGKISEHLWNEVKSKYESGDFTGSILDSIHFLSNAIREKTGLETDGASLVGQAFGGKDPKLKVNKLQTESERNVQQGIEQLLRGIYQAFRNPRSHEKFNDIKEDADSIIVFIDYLLKVIDQSKPPFSKMDFVLRVFDPDFVPSEEYATLLIKEIPIKQRLDTFLEVFKKRETGDCQKLKWFSLSLLRKLSPAEQRQVLDLLSDEFKTTDNENTILTAIQVLPPKCWAKLSKVAKLRIENKFISSVKEGKLSQSTGNCKAGAFGTWSNELLSYFSSKDQMARVLISKLFSKDRSEQDYIFKFFFFHIDQLMPQPTKYFVFRFKEALKSGDKRFYDALDRPYSGNSTFFDAVSVATKKELDEFKEIEPDEPPPEHDDVPF